MRTPCSAVVLFDEGVPLWSVLLRILINESEYAVSLSAMIRQVVRERNKPIAPINFIRTRIYWESN
jgi:hypothetical protein